MTDPVPAVQAVPSRSPLPESEVERALDTLASVLQTLGRHAFDTDERPAADVEQRFEGLAQRLLVGPTRADDAQKQDGSASQRDYGSIRRAVVDQRGHERAFVQRSLLDLREALRAFAQALAISVAEDRASDAQLGAQVGRLVGAFGTNDTATLRREAELVAQSFRAAAEHRRKRESDQISLLTDKVRALRSELSEARARAAVDPLTGLFNRASLEEHLDRVSALGLLLGSEPALLMLDVDHFKQVNDEFGHPAGDRVLKDIADTLLRTFLRKEDFVARYGGEEFAIVVTECPLATARARSDRLREVVNRLPFSVEGRPFKVSICVGIAALKLSESKADWLSRADRALYDAKVGGRNRVVVAE
ncbi:MAG TPA: GGDEF domain-containing protein [Polyangiaceae bacterium]